MFNSLPAFDPLAPRRSCLSVTARAVSRCCQHFPRDSTPGQATLTAQFAAANTEAQKKRWSWVGGQRTIPSLYTQHPKALCCLSAA